MDDKLMYNITNNDKQNQPFVIISLSLDADSFKPTNQKFVKVHNVFKTTNKKRCY